MSRIYLTGHFPTHKVSIKYIAPSPFAGPGNRYQANFIRVLVEKNGDRGREFIRAALDAARESLRKSTMVSGTAGAKLINRPVLSRFAFASLFRAICLGASEGQGDTGGGDGLNLPVPRDDPPGNRRVSRSSATENGTANDSCAIAETRLRQRLSADSRDSPSGRS